MATVEFKKVNSGAVAAPTATDDSTLGYSKGSVWMHGDDIYFCVDPTAAAAVWQLQLAPRAKVAEAVTGSLTVATHSGRMLVTSGNVTVPHASGSKGFNAVIVAGGAHTVTFNSTVSAAMAAGDMMTVMVQDDASGTPTIRATLVEAADQVGFT